ncbi:ParA family protein [Gluconacetobacter sp. 1b LMG 1731]|uniref:ParA family protein n=1 Tax=Gluconacetobacter dulcium TaxID=2729096 RepID=A0A7W4IHQ7_9PROT|nr:ParA family protein [Gluconacetobacter dulcium]MBB2163128.1 ParA family protein [Gluconacetobacter dulcium]MBB2192177.1 ParA family protein [Gluconacetobacter dulcium]
MATSIAFFNNKGGVGKTTLLCNVAAYAAEEYKFRVLVIDADPQCNATQYMFDDKKLTYFYDETSSFTLHNVIRPLSLGKGYSKEFNVSTSPRFGVDVLPGDPRLALAEDLLAQDWGAAIGGDPRGMRTTLMFAELMKRCEDYDLVFFDVGPSLGSINRSVLLASDYFVAPMSIDIFSVKAIDNIAAWMSRWRKQWISGVENVDDPDDVGTNLARSIGFLGYASQHYIAKADAFGTKRAVNAYEKIMKQFESIVSSKLSTIAPPPSKITSFLLGSIPNLHSLIPMSQTARAPVFDLKAADGVKGAHFSKVKDARETFGTVAEEILARAGLK